MFRILSTVWFEDRGYNTQDQNLTSKRLKTTIYYTHGFLFFFFFFFFHFCVKYVCVPGWLYALMGKSGHSFSDSHQFDPTTKLHAAVRCGKSDNPSVFLCGEEVITRVTETVTCVVLSHFSRCVFKLSWFNWLGGDCPSMLHEHDFLVDV